MACIVVPVLPRLAMLSSLCCFAACASARPETQDAHDQTSDAASHFDIAHQDGKVDDAAPLFDTLQSDIGAGADGVAADVATAADAPADAPQAVDSLSGTDVVLVDAAAPECGDGVCNGNETTDTCYGDCPLVALCGDGACNGTENTSNCLKDCPTGSPICGDGLCQKPEGPLACPVDCNPLVSGILVCLQAKCGAATAACLANQACYNVLGEAAACLTNCAGSADCVDWCKTSVSKTPLAVPVVDCGFDACLGAPAGKICGDGTCEASETKMKCPSDCPDPAKCGDGACSLPESMATCPVDCKPA